MLEDHQIPSRGGLRRAYMRDHRWAMRLIGRQVALKEHDERQLYLARQNIRDLRNIYAVLTDIIHKNLAKVRLFWPYSSCRSAHLSSSFVHRKATTALACTDIRDLYAIYP